MKGLLLKDLYMLKHYCGTYLLIAAVFFAVSAFGGAQDLFAFYPCLLCGMIPVNLLSYDERSRFTKYASTLPVTGRQIVSAKYLMGLITEGAVLLAAGIVQAVKLGIRGEFVFADFALTMLSMAAVALLASSIPLPFLFRFGVEKGRIAYYAAIAFVIAAGAVFGGITDGAGSLPLSGGALAGILFGAGAAVFLLSWALSTVLYEKREK